jgi:tetratricopeptide (TPR) repeat protein
MTCARWSTQAWCTRRWAEPSARYALYVTIRAYADDTSARGRRAGRSAPRPCRHFPGAGRTQWRRARPAQLSTRCARNLDNLRAALRYWIDAGMHEAVRLAAALKEFWYARGHLREGRAWLAQALAVDAIADAARGYALLSAGQLAHNQGDHADAHRCWRTALAIFTTLQDVRGRAAALNELAWLHFDGHDPTAAVDLFRAGDHAGAASG